jgi:hypothetical protein
MERDHVDLAGIIKPILRTQFPLSRAARVSDIAIPFG